MEGKNMGGQHPIETEDVVARVKEITLDNKEPSPTKPAVRFEDVINFVNKIKERFIITDGNHATSYVYTNFLDILNKYRRLEATITEVYDEVSNLFKDHPDLIEEFAGFLPDTS